MVKYTHGERQQNRNRKSMKEREREIETIQEKLEETERKIPKRKKNRERYTFNRLFVWMLHH